MRNVAVALVVAMGLSLWGCASSTTGASAASACISAYEAGAQYQAGQRSLASTMSALQKAESDERAAATQDPRYQTVVDDIVGLEADITGTGSGGHLHFLSVECGPDHS